MNRRTFLSRGTLAPLGLASPPLLQPRLSGQATSSSPPSKMTQSLAGVSLDALRAKYRAELFDEFLPFWQRHGIDHVHGGFMCALEQDGTPRETDKLLVFQGRGLWVWSVLYARFGKSADHLEVARRTYRFCADHMRLPDGTWRSRVTRDGRAMDDAKANLSAALYLAEGLDAYARASGDDEPRAIARALLLETVRQGRAAGTPSRQGFWFLILRVATQMLAAGPDEDVDVEARRAADLLVLHHYNPETGLQDELLTPDFRRSSEDAGFTIFGHSIEALWMLLDHAVHLGDERLFDRLVERVKRHLDVGWDRVYDGLTHAVHVDRGGFEWPVERPLGTVCEFPAVGEYHYMKSYWTLAEVLVACLAVLERRQAPWAANYYERAQRVIDERLALEPLGLPLYTLFTDRRLTRGMRTGRAENYHHPRMLMHNILALDRLTARDGPPA